MYHVIVTSAESEFFPVHFQYLAILLSTAIITDVYNSSAKISPKILPGNIYINGTMALSSIWGGLCIDTTTTSIWL